MTRYFYAALMVCCSVQAAPVAAPDMKCSLTVNGKEIALKHALVLDFDDAEGMGDGPELRILFSDAEVAQKELESPVLFNLDALARAKKFQGVLLRYNPKAETREVYGTAYVTPDNPQTSMPFFTLSGDAGGVESLKVEAGKLTGKVQNSAEGDTSFGTPSYAFDLSFTAPIQKATAAKVLKGKEAMATPQMKIYLQFEEAMGKGDLDTVRKMTTPEKSKQMDEYIAQAGKEQFLAMTKQMVADPATREQALAGMFVRGDRTTIVFDDKDGKMSVTLMKKGDTWILE